MSRLHELTSHVRRCHTGVQIHHFIVVKGGAFCDYGALRQALREVHTRTGVVRSALLRIEELRIDLDEAGASQDGSCYDRRRNAVAVARLTSDLMEAKRDLKERIFEFSEFYGLACALKDRVERTHGPLTDEKHAELDMAMWCHRLKRDAANELLSGRRITSTILDSVASLPTQQRSRLMKQIMSPQELLSWLSQTSYTLPSITERLSPVQVQKYVTDSYRAGSRLGNTEDSSSRRVLESRPT